MSDIAPQRWRVAATHLTRRLRGQPFSEPARPLAIRHTGNGDRLLFGFLIASLPMAILVAWRNGSTLLADNNSGEALIDWRLQLLGRLGLELSTPGVATSLIVGITLIMTAFIIAAIVSVAWAVTFAALRDRIVDPGWLMTAWLFTLLLTPATSLGLVALGASFAAVFGQHVFGGTGRYIASPAVVGALFLQVAYPATAIGVWQWPADEVISNAELFSWPPLAGGLADWPAAYATMACIAGALWLAYTGIASHRSLLGALAGLLLATLVTGLLGDALPVHWHFIMGSFAFGWAFLLTDPTTLPLTRLGRWLHGGLFGLLVVVMRQADPTHPESTLFALLLAGLLVPLLDFAVLRLTNRRRRAPMEIAR